MSEEVQELNRRFEGHLIEYRIHTQEDIARKIIIRPLTFLFQD